MCHRHAVRDDIIIIQFVIMHLDDIITDQWNALFQTASTSSAVCAGVYDWTEWQTDAADSECYGVKGSGDGEREGNGSKLRKPKTLLKTYMYMPNKVF